MDNKSRCQSCGMPLDVGLYGTNENGTASDEYCKYCFENGKFREPAMTMQEMMGRCAARLIDNEDMDRDSAEKHANELIPTLKRWAGQNSSN